MHDEKRVIKKYPNRRLYDTAISRYITLQEIKQLVMERADFVVIDAKSEEDLTTVTLLQIILEQEDSQAPIFTREVLENIIRFYGHSLQNMMTQYLEQSMNFFMAQQAKVQQGIGQLWGPAQSMNFFKEVADNNMRLWQNWQELLQEAMKKS